MRYLKSAKTIKEGRKRKGLNQRQLAKILGLSHGLISHWEKGRKRPGLEIAQRLSLVIDIDVNDL